MNFRELNKLAKNNGWYEVDQEGSHHHYKHPTIKGKLTIPEHGGKDLHPRTVNSILKMMGLK